MVVTLSFKECWILLETLMIPFHSTCGTPVLLTPLVQAEIPTAAWVTPGLQHTLSFLYFSPGISLMSFLLCTSYQEFVILPSNKLLRPSDAVQMDSWPPCTWCCIPLTSTWVWAPCPGRITGHGLPREVTRFCFKTHSISNNKPRSSWHWIFWNTFDAF